MIDPLLMVTRFRCVGIGWQDAIAQTRPRDYRRERNALEYELGRHLGVIYRHCVPDAKLARTDSFRRLALRRAGAADKFEKMAAAEIALFFRHE